MVGIEAVGYIAAEPGVVVVDMGFDSESGVVGYSTAAEPGSVVGMGFDSELGVADCPIAAVAVRPSNRMAVTVAEPVGAAAVVALAAVVVAVQIYLWVVAAVLAGEM